MFYMVLKCLHITERCLLLIKFLRFKHLNNCGNKRVPPVTGKNRTFLPIT